MLIERRRVRAYGVCLRADGGTNASGTMFDQQHRYSEHCANDRCDLDPIAHGCLHKKTPHTSCEAWGAKAGQRPGQLQVFG